MKKGYHSTQPKAFNTIPRSIYLGVILGFGIGMVVSGLIRAEREYIPEIIFAVIGYAIGKWYDDKYCAEKDVPAEELEKQAAEAAAAEVLASGEAEESAEEPGAEPTDTDKSDESVPQESQTTPDESEPEADN